MVDATAAWVWGWLRPSRVFGTAEGKAGCLAKVGPGARRSARATIQAGGVVASVISAPAAPQEARPLAGRLGGLDALV
jgi:hypothetical protein